mgnify:CR=1|jgi:hypothetical protein
MTEPKAIAKGCISAKIEQVIVTKALRGTGTEDDKYREVTQYWSLDGKLLAEKDYFDDLT